MKKAVLYFLMFVACFSVAAQTRLETGGLLKVHEDINREPDRFAGNLAVKIIVIDKITRTLPAEAFAGTGVQNVTFEEPSMITVLPPYIFSDNVFLTSINLPRLLKIIEEGAFSGCDHLQKITLPSGLETIQFAAFWNTRISRLYIPNSVTFIGGSILSDALESVRLPANVDVNGSNEFYSAYMQNEKKAGVYTKIRGSWVYGQDMSEQNFYNPR